LDAPRRLGDFTKLNRLFDTLLVNKTMENDKNSFDYIFPVQLSAFFTYLKMFKCCTKEFHYQVDQSGALGYHMEKSLFSGSFFGICKKGAKKTNSQKWMCEETGYITTSGPLTLYQKTRGIDTSKRVRIL